MDDKTCGMEEDGVTIKQEHAYASNDDLNISSLYESPEDDPLKIMPCDIEKVKSESDCENVEIKIEPDLEHILEQNNDMDTTECNETVNPVEVATTQVNRLNDLGNFVPRANFIELQEKYKVYKN